MISKSIKIARVNIARALANPRWSVRGKDRLIRALAGAPTTAIPFTFEGLRMCLNMQNHIEREMLLFGSYAADELAILRTACEVDLLTRQHCVYYDVGANIGQHVLYMSRHANHTYAFEPYAPVRERLQCMILENQIQNVTVYPVALSNESASMCFEKPTSNNLGTGRLTAPTASAQENCTTVAVVHGGQFVRNNGLQGMTVLKIDVEGHEWEVLAGLSDALTTNRPSMLIEVSSRAISSIAKAPIDPPWLDQMEIFRVLPHYSRTVVDLVRQPLKSPGMYFFLPCEQMSVFNERCSNSEVTPQIRII